jgi:hypothetical protein
MQYHVSACHFLKLSPELLGNSDDQLQRVQELHYPHILFQEGSV